MRKMHETEIDMILDRRKLSLQIKRITDIVWSLLGLFLLAPVFFLISLVIKFDSRGSVFFRQIRIGLGGREFYICKFRTMYPEAERQGLQITVGNDLRITKVGRFLRKYKMDELPQLFNVLSGDMSFVGPRPEVPRYVSRYDNEQREILKVRPGITDPAALAYLDESRLLALSENPEKTYQEEILPAKLVLSRKYLQEISLWTDIKLIMETIWKIGTGIRGECNAKR